jgi:hypothetical protein
MCVKADLRIFSQTAKYSKRILIRFKRIILTILHARKHSHGDKIALSHALLHLRNSSAILL